MPLRKLAVTQPTTLKLNLLQLLKSARKKPRSAKPMTTLTGARPRVRLTRKFQLNT